jgi:hypothetical protein
MKRARLYLYCMDPLGETGETYGPLPRKMYLNAGNKLHRHDIYIYILNLYYIKSTLLQRKPTMLKYNFQNMSIKTKQIDNMVIYKLLLLLIH